VEYENRSFSAENRVPIKLDRSRNYDPKAILVAAGAKFFNSALHDDIFQYVEFPEGWKLEPAELPLNFILVDDRGRDRARLHYSEGFNGRGALLSLFPRFAIAFEYDSFRQKGVGSAIIKDCGIPIHTLDPVVATDGGTIGWAYELAERWLEEHFPDWENPGAYWD
jgi:hypothetical protein